MHANTGVRCQNSDLMFAVNHQSVWELNKKKSDFQWPQGCNTAPLCKMKQVFLKSDIFLAVMQNVFLF